MRAFIPGCVGYLGDTTLDQTPLSTLWKCNLTPDDRDGPITQTWPILVSISLDITSDPGAWAMTQVGPETFSESDI